MSAMISEAQFSRLLDIALAATHRGLVADGRAVLEGLLTYWPGHQPTLIALAFNHAVVGDFEKAVAILKDEALAKNKDDQQALAMLGLTLKLAERTEEAQEVLTALSKSSDQEVAALAQTLAT
jgi:cytochrome c-type biogenesis protein CcmH/NrfG